MPIQCRVPPVSHWPRGKRLPHPLLPACALGPPCIMAASTCAVEGRNPTLATQLPYGNALARGHATWAMQWDRFGVARLAPGAATRARLSASRGL